MILVTGANGQLGTELRYLLDERGEEYVAVDVAEMDITNAEKVDEVFAQVKPTLVYHCAAYTAVDAAEDESKELDYAINVTGTEIIAKATAKYGATLVTSQLTTFLMVKNQLVKNGKLMILQILKPNTVVQNVWVKKRLKNTLKTSTSSVLLGYLVTTVKTLFSQCKILPKLMTH